MAGLGGHTPPRPSPSKETVMKKVSVPSNPGRLINAVAAMGYDPEVALTDILDNSLDATSSVARVTLIPESHEDEGETDTIHSYLIADDGVGMDEETLVSAFTLGTERNYAPHSLGKFGLGLKSAGLSLANEIAIITKTKAVEDPICGILQMSVVEESGKYEIDLGPPPDDLAALWEKYRASEDHGTITVLRELKTNQPAFAKFRDYLKRHMSIIYHKFMQDEEHPFTISINGDELVPLDPLFMAEARQNGPLAPQDWLGKSVHLLLEPNTVDLDGVAECSVAATHLVHPPSFEAEGRRPEIREEYAIETDPYTRRQRHGFYIYRNKRVIVMAERFHGLVSAQTQAWAFRGSLEFDESADSILSLDVKKRHCQLPKRARNNLKALISTYQARSVEAWKAAGKRENERKRVTREDIANQSLAQTPVAELNYAPGADLTSDAALQARKQLQANVGKATLQSIQDPNVTEETLDDLVRSKSYVTVLQGLKSNAMWLPYPSVHLGRAETLVNKAHSWVAEAYAASETQPGITIILHHLFTILARAELEVRSTDWKDISSEQTTKILERFRIRSSMIGEDLADQLAQALEEGLGEIDPDSD